MFKGKALLVITRNEDFDGYHWDIHPFVQALNKEDHGGEVGEAFSFIMQFGYHIAPSAAYKMEVGDTIRVAVTFELHFTHNPYTGEWDSELYLTKQRVLRRQPYNSKRFRKNFYKLVKSSTQI